MGNLMNPVEKQLKFPSSLVSPSVDPWHLGDVPTAAEMLIICQQLFHLMSQQSQDRCEKQVAPSFHHLDVFTTYHGSCGPVLLGNSLQTQCEHHQVSAHSGPQSTKTSGKNDPEKTCIEKQQVVWNLKPLGHLCYTAYISILYVYIIYIYDI